MPGAVGPAAGCAVAAGAAPGPEHGAAAGASDAPPAKVRTSKTRPPHRHTWEAPMKPSPEQVDWARLVIADHADGRCSSCPVELAGRRCPRVVSARQTLILAGLAS